MPAPTANAVGGELSNRGLCEAKGLDREAVPSAPSSRPELTGPSPNRGPIVFPEKRPADPVKDAATARVTHRGGLASARAELY